MKSSSSSLPAPDARDLLLLGWIRWRALRSGASALLRAPLKLAVVVSAWLVLLVGIYVLFYEGLQFLYETAGVGPFLLDRLWYLFLFVVAVMLAMSQLASAYSTIIRSPETMWWMGFPLTPRAIFRAKWLESSAYSAWAVVLLAVPLCLAYLTVLHRPLWLLGWMGWLLLPLLLIVTACVTIVLLAWLRWCGPVAVRREVMAVGFVAACAVLFWMLGERHQEHGPQDVWFIALQELLPRMRVAMALWVPSAWVAKGLSAGLRDLWAEGWLYAGLLWATALLCWRLCDHAGAVLLFPLMRKQGRSPEGGQRRASIAPLRIVWWMRRSFTTLLMKDVLLVSRDPMQWSQAVVFFGLLGAYFANIHRLTLFSTEPAWRLGIASLNLACTLLVFGSLAVRFIFPQMSLEGRSLWLVRVAPDGIKRLVQAKLCLYGALAVVIIEGLLWLSTGRLGVPMAIRWWLAGVGVLASLAIVGLTVGLGACWIDPSARDAARIVSSSSGALVLVLMLAYVGCVTWALAVAWAGWAVGSLFRLMAASAALGLLSFLTATLPVQLGLARLERLENAS